MTSVYGSRVPASTAAARVALGLVCVLLFPSCEDDAPDPWVATWTTSMADAGPGLQDATLRQVVRLSVGGQVLRVRLSHEFGTEPTRIGAASVGLSLGGADVQPGTLRPLTFGGSRAVELAPGADLRSDPVDLPVPTGASLVVSLYLAADSGDATRHRNAAQTSFVVAGNHADAFELVPDETNTSFHWLAGVEIDSPEAAFTVAAFGDSITEGSGSSLDLHNRYPDVLQRELSARGVSAAVLNAGIGGNRVLSDGWGAIGAGPAGVSRFEQDALSLPGVTHVLLLEGVNDLGMGATLGPVVSAEDVIRGYETLIRRAHRRGVSVLVGTILPFRGATFPRYWSAENEAKRQTINAWIRTTNRHDGVVDFDEVMRDPSDPERLDAALHSGDFLHPNDAGYQRMGELAASALDE